MIKKEGRDYRVCTACMGPALVPTTVKSPKDTDIRIKIGDNTLYISRVQAMYIDHVSIDMVYDAEEIDSCPAFYVRRNLN
jgi:Fe-S cluster assembly iron-binding protein IscA